MNLKRVGFYKEMEHGESCDPSILDNIKIKQYKADIDNICCYLNSGIPLIVCAGTVEDVINPDNGTAGTPTFFTDGRWVWPGDLSYYVKNYNLKLPDEFINTMRQADWKVPITIDDLDCENFEIDGINPFN